MAVWDPANLASQAGKTAVITGANSGTGLCAAYALARAGARVILACRSAERGQLALQRLRAEVPTAAVELHPLDLADLGSVRRFAQQMQSTKTLIDVLLNNAGVMAVPSRMLTRDGFELQMGTNHLGHFALTMALLPILWQRPGARVVTVSSQAHRGGKIELENLQSGRTYHPWRAYNASKLANLLFAFELDRRLRAAHAPVKSLAAHPGMAWTELSVKGPRLDGITLTARVISGFTRLVGQSDVEGAWPILYAATQPDLQGGTYYGPDGLFEVRGAPKQVKGSAAAYNADTAQALWRASETLTGTSMPSFVAAS